MALPTETLHWATDENDPEGHATKTMPPAEIQKTGLLKGQPMGRQWFNQILWYVLEVTGLANRVGAILYFTHTQPDLDADTTHWKKTQIADTNVTGGQKYQYERIA